MAGESLIADEANARGSETDGKPHLDEAGKVMEIIGGLVEDAMPQTGTKQDAEETIEEQGLEEFVLYLLVLIEFLHYEVGACQAQHPKEGVEAQGANADGGIPSNHFREELRVKRGELKKRKVKRLCRMATLPFSLR